MQELKTIEDVLRQQTKHVLVYTVILGVESDEEIIFTWHPGEPLRPYNGKLFPDTAVKLHNG